jgi:hypothetical protein
MVEFLHRLLHWLKSGAEILGTLAVALEALLRLFGRGDPGFGFAAA